MKYKHIRYNAIICEAKTIDETQKTTDGSFLYTEIVSLLFGLASHSFCVGITIGLDSTNIGFIIALFIHQIFEGFALGMRIVQAKSLSFYSAFSISFLFAISTPIGILIGITLKNFVRTQIILFPLLIGVFYSVSAGMLIFISIVHLLEDEMKKESTKNSFTMQFMLFSGTICGGCISSLIAIWA